MQNFSTNIIKLNLQIFLKIVHHDQVGFFIIYGSLFKQWNIDLYNLLY